MTDVVVGLEYTLAVSGGYVAFIWLWVPSTFKLTLSSAPKTSIHHVCMFVYFLPNYHVHLIRVLGLLYDHDFILSTWTYFSSSSSSILHIHTFAFLIGDRFFHKFI